MRGNRTSGRRQLTVGAHVALGVVACAVAVSALIGTAAYVSFQQERDHTDAALHAAAQDAADEQTLSISGVSPVLEGLAASGDIASFDPASCAATMESLQGGVVGVRLHVFDPAGRVVCSFDDPEIGPAAQPVGAWFDEVVESGENVQTDPAVDPVSGHPATLVAVPIPGADGRTGALLAVVYGGGPTLVRAAGVPDDTVILLLDPSRELVLATTPDAFAAEGPTDGTMDFAAVREGKPVTIEDPHGETWLFTDSVVPDLGWHALAGRRESAALGPAKSLLHTMLLIGGGALIALGALGALLRRRLVCPLRAIESVADRSARDDDVRAAMTGPAELAGLAGRLNALLDERQAREADLRWRALHDVLTGLPNRAAVAERLTQLLDEDDGPVSVLFIDLDRFKQVNDTHGHSTGDRLLVDLAERLDRLVDGDAILGRFGGDEFVVVAPDMEAADAIPLAQRLIEVVQLPFDIQETPLYVSACVGIASARQGDLADEVIGNADIAMYDAKGKGTGSIELFDAALRERTSSRLRLEQDLHGALERGELVLHYQPIVDVHTRAVLGVEALMRWQHPERGLVPPDEFISIADESGLLVSMGEWAIRVAAERAAEWSTLFGRPFPVAVNVAASQLAAGDLATRVAGILADTGIDPSLLHLEVTESSLLRDPEIAATVLSDLRTLGVPVSLDDFGTGYSSLSYLQVLPLDAIKIDRSFVSRLDLGSTSSRIVRSVLDLAGALHLDVVAEGVETSRQLDNLRRLGCRHAQGYLFSRPVPAEQIADLARAGRGAMADAASA